MAEVILSGFAAAEALGRAELFDRVSHPLSKMNYEQLLAVKYALEGELQSRQDGDYCREYPHAECLHGEACDQCPMVQSDKLRRFEDKLKSGDHEGALKTLKEVV